MSAQHLSAVHDIEMQSFSCPWTRRAFSDMLANPYARYYTATAQDGTIAGFIGLFHAGEDGEIHNFAVAESFRRQGIGALLLETVLVYCRENCLENIYLEVRASNKDAISIYKKYGFEKIGIRKNYYKSPREDAVIMQCSLKLQTDVKC